MRRHAWLTLCLCASLLAAPNLTAAAGTTSGVNMITGGSTTSTKDGDYRKLVLKENGELWSIGSQTTDGQQDNGNPQKMMDHITYVASNGLTSFAVDDQHALWGWGYNADGQLCTGTTSNVDTPVKLRSNVEMAAVGGSQSMILDQDGTLYGCGNNAKGELGVQSNGEQVTTPKKIMANVRYAATHFGTTMVIRDNGELWGWGTNCYGQAANENTGWFDSDPIVISTPAMIMKDVKYVAVGGDTVMAITFDGTLWGFGSNQFHQISTTQDHKDASNNYVETSPQQVMTNVKYVSLSDDGAVYALKTDNSLWNWGANYTRTDEAPRKKVMEDVKYAYFAYNQGLYVIKDNGELWSYGKDSLSPEKIFDSGTSKPPVDPVRDKLFRNASSWALIDLRYAGEHGLTAPVQKLDFSNSITRGQFCEIAVKLYEAMTGTTVAQTGDNPFSDTKNSEILKAYQLGIVNGVASNLFAPDDLITREQLASMMMRTLTKSGKTIPSGDPIAFSDHASFSSFAIESINFMSSANIIKGVTDDTFGPQQQATIEQALIMAKRLLERL